ncbi:MAG TPA: prephenate dehydrogenase/arogenate dehydrogenase family protein [Terriglobales bacterium]
MAISQVTVLGTGLIGGSLALALKKRGIRVVGSDRPEVLEKARRLGAVDEGLSDPIQACKGSAVVVLATPVGSIIDLIERVGPLLPETTLLTDVGSTKAEIVARAKSVFGDAVTRRFLGGHPMVGKERSGIEHASAELFQDATWLFAAPEELSTGTAVGREFIDLVRSFPSRTYFFDPAQHDRICAWVSHLPQMLSTALASTLLEEAAAGTHIHQIGGRALREMTRIASSPYSMWRDIAFTNTHNIADALLKLEQKIAHIRENLRTPELRKEFEQANRFPENP